MLTCSPTCVKGVSKIVFQTQSYDFCWLISALESDKFNHTGVTGVYKIVSEILTRFFGGIKSKSDELGAAGLEAGLQSLE